MKPLYSTMVTVVGGRNGAAASDDGILDLKLAQPTAIGGRGGATNPLLQVSIARSRGWLGRRRQARS